MRLSTSALLCGVLVICGVTLLVSIEKLSSSDDLATSELMESSASFGAAERDIEKLNGALDKEIASDKAELGTSTSSELSDVSSASSLASSRQASLTPEVTKRGKAVVVAGKGKGLKSGEAAAAIDRSVANGLWTDKTGPPYLSKVLLYYGEGVNEGTADKIRRWFDFKLSFRDHRWVGPRYLGSFEGSHFRFLSRSTNRRIIFPPLSGPAAYLSDESGKRLARFVKAGNTLIVCGGVQNILFLNSILPFLGYSGDLELKWDEGPFEKQRVAATSRFTRSSVVLPGDAWGVTVNSLPVGALSYYEAPGVSVVFSVKVGKGSVVYAGNTLGDALPAWKEVVMEAAQITDEQITAI